MPVIPAACFRQVTDSDRARCARQTKRPVYIGFSPIHPSSSPCHTCTIIRFPMPFPAISPATVACQVGTRDNGRKHVRAMLPANSAPIAGSVTIAAVPYSTGQHSGAGSARKPQDCCTACCERRASAARHEANVRIHDAMRAAVQAGRYGGACRRRERCAAEGMRTAGAGGLTR